MKKLLSQLDILLFLGVLAACIGLLMIDLGTGLSAAREAQGGADKALAELQTARDEDRYTGSEGAQILASLDGIIGQVNEQWNPKDGPAVGTSRLMYSPESLDDLRKGRAWEIHFPAPLELNTRVDLGLIELSWAIDDKTSVRIENFEVYRQTGTGPETKVGVVPGTNQIYQDRNVKAGVAYRYRVRAQTDDIALRALKKTKSEFSIPTQASGMRDFQFEAIDYDEKSAQLRFLVKKHQAKVWHEKQFLATKGQEIGARDPGSGVNYATGTKVTDIKLKREKVPQTRKEIVFDAEGRAKSSAGQALVQDRVYQVDRLTITVTLESKTGDVQIVTLVKDD